MRKLILFMFAILLTSCTLHLYEVTDNEPVLTRSYKAYDYYTSRRTSYTPRYNFWNRYDSKIIYRYPTYLRPIVRPPLERAAAKENSRTERRAVPRRPSVQPTRPIRRIPVRRDTIR